MRFCLMRRRICRQIPQMFFLQMRKFCPMANCPQVFFLRKMICMDLMMNIFCCLNFCYLSKLFLPK